MTARTAALRTTATAACLVALVAAAACGGGKPCTSPADCGGSDVCLPTADGAQRYCAGLDDSCPTGLRWDDTAGGGLDGQCVGIASGIDAQSVDAPARDAPVDTSSACAEGAVCMPTTDPCKVAGKCQGGVCQPITDAADGTKCGTASDPCRTDPVCSAGTCGAEGTRPTGFNYDPGNYLARCCNGVPTTINTPDNCGACGISCGGRGCVNTGATNPEQWWCSCTASSLCWSGCCATGNVCSPSTCGEPAHCITCPGGSSCTESQNPHYWCHY
jgi:hypothetical protein